LETKKFEKYKPGYLQGEIFAFMDQAVSGNHTASDIGFFRDSHCWKIDIRWEAISRKNDCMRRMSLLFQNPALFNTSVFNNVAYGLVVRGENNRTIEKKVIDALDLVDLQAMKNRKHELFQEAKHSAWLLQGRLFLNQIFFFWMSPQPILILLMLPG